MPPPKRKTRGQGEGSIYPRKDGLWVAAINLGWHDGKRQRKYFYGATRADVATKLNDALKAQREGKRLNPPKQTVAAFLERWLADVVSHTCRETTLRHYRTNVRRHLIPRIGDKQLARLTAQDVQAMLRNRLDAGLSPNTVRGIHATLRIALAQAERWELVPRNVAALATPPRPVTFLPMPLTPAEANALLAHVATHRLAALYEVSIRLGLRRGESLGLRWRDVDLETGILRVRHSLQRINKKPALVEPKTESSRRTIDLTPPVVAVLRAHRERQTIERDLAGDRWDGSWQLVFCNTRGRPVDESHLSKLYHRHLDGAGIAQRRWHDLRHTAATLMLAAGVPERVIMAIMGHASINLTRHYSHVLPPTRQDAMRRVDALLSAQIEPNANGWLHTAAAPRRHPEDTWPETGAATPELVMQASAETDAP